MTNIEEKYSEYLKVISRKIHTADCKLEECLNIPLVDLGISSLDTISLLFDLEDELGVTIDDSNITPEAFSTPASVWELIKLSA